MLLIGVGSAFRALLDTAEGIPRPPLLSVVDFALIHLLEFVDVVQLVFKGRIACLISLLECVERLQYGSTLEPRFNHRVLILHLGTTKRSDGIDCLVVLVVSGRFRWLAELCTTSWFFAVSGGMQMHRNPLQKGFDVHR
jgi:hypothetical protein